MSTHNQQSAGLTTLYVNIDRQFELLLERMQSLVPSQEKLDALREARLRLEKHLAAWDSVRA